MIKRIQKSWWLKAPTSLFGIKVRLISGGRNWIPSVHCAFGEDLQQTATWQRCPLDVGDFKLLFKSGPSCAEEGKKIVRKSLKFSPHESRAEYGNFWGTQSNGDETSKPELKISTHLSAQDGNWIIFWERRCQCNVVAIFYFFWAVWGGGVYQGR